MSKSTMLLGTDDAQAVLSGHKTVIRMVLKPQPKFTRVQITPGKWPYAIWSDSDGEHQVAGPYDIGDIIAAKEPWAELRNADGSHKRYVYAASDEYPFGEPGYIAQFRWKSAAQMPKDAVRIFLRITNVQVMRLQDGFVDRSDAIFAFQQEGVEIPEECIGCIDGHCNQPCCIDEDGSECGLLDDIRCQYVIGWDCGINPKNYSLYNWDANPFVWVITFERVDK